MLFCLVPSLHYSARPKRFGSCGPSEDVRPRQELRELMRQPCPQGLLSLSNMAAPYYWKARRRWGRGCSFACPILAFERETLHLSSNTFVEHARHVAKIKFRNQA